MKVKTKLKTYLQLRYLVGVAVALPVLFAIMLGGYRALAETVTVGYTVRGVGQDGTGALVARRCVEAAVFEGALAYLDTTCGTNGDGNTSATSSTPLPSGAASPTPTPATFNAEPLYRWGDPTLFGMSPLLSDNARGSASVTATTTIAYTFRYHYPGTVELHALTNVAGQATCVGTVALHSASCTIPDRQTPNNRLVAYVFPTQVAGTVPLYEVKPTPGTLTCLSTVQNDASCRTWATQVSALVSTVVGYVYKTQPAPLPPAPGAPWQPLYHFPAIAYEGGEATDCYSLQKSSTECSSGGALNGTFNRTIYRIAAYTRSSQTAGTVQLVAWATTGSNSYCIATDASPCASDPLFPQLPLKKNSLGWAYTSQQAGTVPLWEFTYNGSKCYTTDPVGKTGCSNEATGARNTGYYVLPVPGSPIAQS